MLKQDLIEEVARSTGVTQRNVRAVLSHTEALIAKTLANGDDAKIGFATFRVVDRPARTGRNPRTGEAVEIPARKVVKIKAGKFLEDAANGERCE